MEQRNYSSDPVDMATSKCRAHGWRRSCDTTSMIGRWCVTPSTVYRVAGSLWGKLRRISTSYPNFCGCS